MDLLMHHPCIKEDDLAELIKLDRKQMRGFINTLKQEHFIKVRMRVETDSEGRTTRHNYYYISYNVLINVIKYKLHNMRRKIEMDERQSTRRPSFVCPNCQSTYTDLDVGRLMTMTGQLFCSYCQTEVEEEASEAPKTSSQSLMTRFNGQMEPIYKLLQELDGINLAPEILEPQPKEMKTARSQGGIGARAAGGEKWSGNASKNMGFDYVNEVTIAMEGKGMEAATTKPKEAPVWMKESTIEGGTKSELSVPPSPLNVGASKEGNFNPSDPDDIMRTLLSHETKSTSASRNDSGDSDSEAFQKPSFSQQVVDEYMNESDDDKQATNWMVEIGGSRIPFQDISEEMLQTMTPAEKEEYIRIGQEMYQDMYD